MLSTYTLIGQLIPLTLMLVLFIVGIRFLLAATRLMNRKTEDIEEALASRRGRGSGDQRMRSNDES